MRKIYLLVFVVCVGLLGFGLYLQHAKGLEPCPLCILQRYAFVLVALVALVAGLHGRGPRVYGALLGLASLMGAGMATRHVWLEHLPKDQVPACGPGLDYILDAFPMRDALAMIFKGSGECAEVAWRFLGLSIAEWSLIWFVAFVVLGVLLALNRIALAKS